MKRPYALLCALSLSAGIIGCKNEDLSAPKTPKMSETANSITAVSPISPISPIGTAPAGPTKEATATTSSAKSDVSKVDQSASMPLAGQANDHSALVPKATEFPKTSP
jgi:hypothetical protein